MDRLERVEEARGGKLVALCWVDEGETVEDAKRRWHEGNPGKSPDDYRFMFIRWLRPGEPDSNASRPVA